MLVYRIIRSPERRVFYIDVGNIPPENVADYLQQAQTSLKRNAVVDKTTGQVDLRYNPLSVDEDYFLPVRGGDSGTRIDSLAGGANTGDIEQLNYEADDLLATYAKQILKTGAKVTIISSDKDLMQLVSKEIRLFDPMKSKVIGEKEVKEKFGVKPQQVVDVQSLAGDSSDNIPGVPGIGIKTAAELINKYKNLETLLKKADEIPQKKRKETLIQNKELALISKKLVTLKDDVPVKEQIEEFTIKEVKKEKLYKFLREMEFNRLLSQAISFYGEPENKVENKQIKKKQN